MKATELYRALETALGPWLSAHGFKKRRGSHLVFQRVVGEKFQSVWFQTDKRGWDPYTGSSFFVNFSVSESPDPESGARRAERLNLFLTDEELERAGAYRDEVVARIPRPADSYFEAIQSQVSKWSAESAAGLMEGVRAQFEPESLPYRRQQDFSLRYWQPNDKLHR